MNLFPIRHPNRRLVSSLLTAVAALATLSAIPSTYASIWSGAANGNWDNPSNWDTLPTSADTATFNNNVNTTVSLNGADRAIKTFAFSTTTGSFTFNSTGSERFLLTATGNITMGASVSGTNILATFNSGLVLGGNYAFTNSKTEPTNALIFNGNITNSAASILTLSGAGTGANKITGIISDGSGAQSLNITHTGGSWELSGNNSYSGGTTISSPSGTTIVGHNSAFGTGTITLNGGATLRSIGTAQRTIANAVTINTTTGLLFGTNDGVNVGNLVFTGPVTLNTNFFLTARSANPSPASAVVFEGAIGESGGIRNLTVVGATDGTGQGYIFLLGANSYTGITTLNSSGAAGNVVINTLGDVGSGPSSLGNPSLATSVINLATGNAQSSSGVILRYIGAQTSTDRVLAFGGTAAGSTANAATLDASGYGTLTFTSNMDITTFAVTSTGNRNLILSGTNLDSNTFSGVIPAASNGLNAVNLTKSGVGTWVLNAANGFLGTISPNGGKLVLDYAINPTVIAGPNAVAFGGGTLELKGKTGVSSTSQTLGNVTTTSTTGLSTLFLNKNAGNGVALTVGTIVPSTTISAFLIDLGDSANSLTTATSLTVPNNRILIKDGTGRFDYAKNTGANTAVSALATTNDLVANPLANTDYRLTSDFTVTGASQLARTLRIDPSANNQTLTLTQGTATANSRFAAILMTGQYDFTITQGAGQTGALGNNSGTTTAALIYHYGTGKLTIDTKLAGLNLTTGNGIVEFFGTGLIDWTKPANTSGALYLSGVTLRQSGTTGQLLDTTSSGLGSGNIALSNGGVLEISGATNVTRNVGSGAGAIRWLGDGGFSAFGGTRNIQLNNGTATIGWATASFVPANNALVLSSSSSDAMVDFQNGLDFLNQQRVVRVNNGSAAVDARLSGVLSSLYGGGLIKDGAGTLELTNANTYVGESWIRAGKLAVNNGSGSGTGSAKVTAFSGSTLAGSGTIAGAVAINSGATLAPGNSIGTLTVNNSLTLAGISDFEINKTAATNDSVVGITALTYGGTLKVTNLAGTLAAGDSFDLFNFTSQSGSWANAGSFIDVVNYSGSDLPTLTGGLKYQFAYTTGVLSVAAASGTPNFIFTDTSDVTLNVLKNSSGISTTKTIQNNGSAAGDASLNNTNTNLAVSGNLININSPSGTAVQTLSATNTSNYDTDTGTLTVTPNTGGSNVINTTVNVGFATTGGNHTLGTALTASVANSGSYANLASKTTAGTETGGYTVLGTEAIILEGTNTSGSTATISEQWRTRTTVELTPGNAITGGNGRYLGSDVLDITGIAGTPVLYTLQMSYDSSDFADDAAEIAAAQNGFLYLAWLNGSNLWVNAGDTGAYTTPDINGYQTGTDFALGKWGINATTNTVWAVVNHNSEFAAVVPEPTSLALLALGTLPLLTRRRRSN